MKKLILSLAVLLSAQLVNAQLKSPAEFLGYELGDKLTPHHRVVDYFNHVAATASNVTIKEYGRTYEGRPLLLVTFSSADNMSNLEQIRLDNLARTGLASESSGTNVGIVWLSYNVHGNESNSTEASMATIYKLLTDHSSYLENTVIIMDPCINPDGRDRYVNFITQNGQKPFNPDPQSAEHDEPWVTGRPNHYNFDLNRDWAWQSQVESQQRIEEYNKWMPHIHVDFHEQGYNSPYYFAPAAKPYHELITEWQRSFQEMIGRNHAKYFDEQNWFYFTKENFDLLYPSYGDTYPTYNGAIGMTYEQGGSGMAVITQNGDTLTLLDRLTHHTVSGLSTVEVASKNKDKMIAEFEKFFDSSVPGTYKSFILKSDNADKMNHLKDWLDKNMIVYGTGANSKGLKGYNYHTKRTESFSIGSNDLVINVDQPKGMLAKILFEPVTNYSDSLTYDITAWSVPYFYGLQAYATASLISVSPMEKSNPVKAQVPESAYAFFFKWDSFQDAQFLAALLKEEVKTRFIDRPITLKGVNYDRGTLVISKRDNSKLGDEFESLVTRIANSYDRKFTTTTTGFMDGGPDLGSRSVNFIKAPRVAMLRGDGVSSYNYGEFWHYFEQQLDYPFTAINLSAINWLDLSKYDVLIMPEGGYGNLRESQMKKISSWVKSGGKLIAVGSSIRKFADSDYAGLSKFNSDKEKEEFKKKQEGIDENNKLLPYGNRSREYAKNRIPGAIFKVTLDNTHPLSFGYEKTYFSLKRSGSRYGYLDSQNVGVIKSSSDHMSGFSGQYVTEAVGKSMVFGVESSGAGELVYFVDNPMFRAFWYNSKLMVANAIFFVGQD